MRFLGLGIEDAVPDAKTLWLYREALVKAGAVEEPFDLFDAHLKDKGYLAMGGQIIDATIVSAPKQHNSREENEAIKEGKTPADWKSSRVHRRAYRNRELSEAQKVANKTRSKVRARVEHVFGDQKNSMGAEIVRTIGIVRARGKIGMTNLAYNMRRFICLERMSRAAESGRDRRVDSLRGLRKSSPGGAGDGLKSPQ
jgi:IS5 family transposase